jgi:hypothetical protein
MRASVERSRIDLDPTRHGHRATEDIAGRHVEGPSQNIFTGRGVRFARQIIYKKTGKVSSYR